jgi:hypothetical protein
MPIPDYQSLMPPVLKLAEGGEIHVRDATDRLAEQLALTPEERATMLPSGRQTLLSNLMHWAKTYMQKAGLVRSTRRAHFAITDRGREVLASKTARVDNDLLMRFEAFRDFRTKNREGPFEVNPPQEPNLGRFSLPFEVNPPQEPNLGRFSLCAVLRRPACPEACASSRGFIASASHEPLNCDGKAARDVDSARGILVGTVDSGAIRRCRFPTIKASCCRS